MTKNYPRRIPTTGIAKSEDGNFQNRNHHRSDKISGASIHGRRRRASKLDLNLTWWAG